MGKYLLAIVLALAFVGPASAWSRKAQDKAKQTEMRPATQYQWKSKARRKFERREVEESKDPYWDPCDYTTNWGPHACGGGG
jgi:hypothetical protein